MKASNLDHLYYDRRCCRLDREDAEAPLITFLVKVGLNWKAWAIWGIVELASLAALAWLAGMFR